jgi:lipoate-protein ligase A
VLGSTQDRAVVDDERAAAAGVDVLRRPTGGGAVMVARDAQVWLDIWVPRRHPLWNDDIIDAALWLGDAWVVALESLGGGPLRVHRGPASRGVWADRVCFAGLGPGEVFVDAADTGPKVTGLAQRRTSAGARFHSSAQVIWDPAPLLSLLDAGHSGHAGHDGHDDAPALLTGAAVGLRSLLTTVDAHCADVDLLTTVEDAVIAALP